MNTILFDLDGTLLPMDQDKFIEIYFGLLTEHVAQNGMDPKKLIAFVSEGTKSMILNSGKNTNEVIFWDIASSMLGTEEKNKLMAILDDFYLNKFPLIKSCTWKNPLSEKCVKVLKEKGYDLILATNPVFPRVATLQRVSWAGLDQDDFSYITTYESECFSKPNPKYFEHVLNILSKSPQDCLMVGNDTTDDYGALTCGTSLYLINDCLIDNGNNDLKDVKTGDFADFYRFCNELPYVDSI